MKSKASVNGHPIHPVLITFPVAFFTGTLVFDVIALLYNKHEFWRLGWYLNIAGIVSALLAAISGIIDYLFTVPPSSSAKKRATWHGCINITMVLLFTCSLYMKHRVVLPLPIIVTEIAGFILLLIAGYMGGTMVYRNQIGVYNRYADKGIWKERYSENLNGRIEAALIDELKTDQMKLIHAGNKRIVLGKSENGYVAFDDRCTHKGGSLAGGVMMCNTVQCPWHGSQFDVETGMPVAGPATTKISTYEVIEENGKLYIEMKK